MEADVHGRQHLKRIHSEPIHCPRCFETFENEELRTHLREGGCSVVEERQWEGVVTEQQRKQLEGRVSSHKTKEENWYIIYEVLFPGAPRPRSPCKLIAALTYDKH